MVMRALNLSCIALHHSRNLKVSMTDVGSLRKEVVVRKARGKDQVMVSLVQIFGKKLFDLARVCIA